MTSVACSRTIRLLAVGIVLLMSAGGVSEATMTCDHVIKDTGSGAKRYRVCVSGHGNVVEFQSPAGIDVTSFHKEGYNLCFSTGTAYDNPNGEANFDEAVVTDLSPLTIDRTTTNGLFKVTQIFAADSAEMDVKITMKVTNLSAVVQSGVFIERQFDGGTAERADTTSDTTQFIYIPGLTTQGIALQATTFSTPHTTAISDKRVGWHFAECQEPSIPVPAPVGDYVQIVGYRLGSINPGATKTVVFTYRRL